MVQTKPLWAIRLISLFLSILLILPLLSCRPQNENNSKSIKLPTITILKLGDHRVINAVEKGIKMRLEHLFKPHSYKIVTVNANFDMGSLGEMARVAVTSDADVLISITTPASNAMIGANRGWKPLVFTFVTDPGQLGYKEPGSLNNTTGMSDEVDYSGTVELINMLLPNSKRVGYLLTRSESNARVIYNSFRPELEAAGFTVVTAELAAASDLRVAAATLVESVDFFLFGGDNTIANNIEVLFDVARTNGLPVIANDELSVEGGALAAISVDYQQMGERTAELAVLLLAGADPSLMPVEVLTADRLVVNLDTAADLAINVPEDLLRRSSRVIRGD